MTTLDSVISTPLSGSRRRLAAWAATASGIIGVMALGLLIAAVQAHVAEVESELAAGRMQKGVWEVRLFRSQDVGLILQALLMIPVVSALPALGAQRFTGLNQATSGLGVVAHVALALALVLNFVFPDGSDMLYMVPLGVVGLWLIIVNWLLSGTFSPGLRRTGMVAGIGLVVIGLSCLAIAAAIGPFVLAAWGPNPRDIDPVKMSSLLNRMGHLGLLIGTIMGRAVYPIWAILLGRRLLRSGAW